MLLGLDILNSGFNTIINNQYIYNIIKTSQNSNLLSILFGIFSTAIIQSSSGTTAIAISLLSSNYIKPNECLGIIIGANLGTCLTTFIVAINVDNLCMFILIIGILA